VRCFADFGVAKPERGTLKSRAEGSRGRERNIVSAIPCVYAGPGTVWSRPSHLKRRLSRRSRTRSVHRTRRQRLLRHFCLFTPLLPENLHLLPFTFRRVRSVAHVIIRSTDVRISLSLSLLFWVCFGRRMWFAQIGIFSSFGSVARRCLLLDGL